MADEFAIAGNRYRFNGMSAQTETRIQRRFASFIAAAVPLVIASGSKFKLRQNIDIPKVVQTVIGGWAKLSDDDLDMIERATLGATSREMDGEWQSVWPKGDAEPAFEDIDGAVMQILMGHALGFTVKRWMDGGGDAVPAEFRAVFQQMH